MSHTYEELKKMTVAQLREIAKETDHEAVKGYTQLNKDHLLKAVCAALNVDMHVHHEVIGVDKTKIKQRIRQLRKERDEAGEAKDREKMTAARKEIRKLKKTLRRATV
ncbi:MAG: hypothetical protein DWQ10_16795 [Calditrichaeota bacterium]|nr:MAG: hypothetical protein DWQ10_16795 [Calditrichota bacterium]